MEIKLKSVDRKTYKPKKACVYVISHPENIEALNKLMFQVTFIPEDEVYVGVTSGPIAQRWRDHKALRARDNQTTSRFIKKYEYDFEDCFRVIFEGTEDQCYKLEYHLRPVPGMGLNTKAGGRLKHRKKSKHYINMIAEACSS